MLVRDLRLHVRGLAVTAVRWAGFRFLVSVFEGCGVRISGCRGGGGRS